MATTLLALPGALAGLGIISQLLLLGSFDAAFALHLDCVKASVQGGVNASALD
jgi:hypothetical protein